MDDDKKLSKYNKSDVLELVTDWFKTSASAESKWKDKAKEWYSYYDGEQWTSDEVAALTERGQAITTYNHISPSIDAIIGGERQNRPEIKMAGRTPDDERVAQVKTELFRYITYNSDTDNETDSQVKDFLIAGRGWMSVYPNTNGKEFDDIKHDWIDYRDMFSDPLGKRDDLSDSRYVTQAIYTDADIVKAQFPSYKEDASSQDRYFADSSEDELWYEGADRKRPRLMSTWFRDEEGAVSVCVWVQGQVLYFKKSPYSMNMFPYDRMTYKLNLDNEPYGVVKAMVSPQDEVNKRHSKALHLLNAKQVLAEEDAFVDWSDAKKTLARPDGITRLKDGALAEGRIQLVDNTALASAQISMMEHAKSQVMAMAGINASFMGQGGQYESGKAGQSNIAAAQNVLVPMLNKIRIGRYRVAKITMQLVPDFYTDERLIRITGVNGAYSFMPVNQVQQLDDGTLVKFNDISSDDVDIIVEDAPSSLNDRTEQFNQLLSIQGQTGRPIPMEILLRYSGLKDKYQLASDLEAHYKVEAKVEEAQGYIQQLEQQLQGMGGEINQVKSQLVQANLARAVDKEVSKAKGEIEKEKQSILGQM